jgi:hypothetical protein
MERKGMERKMNEEEDEWREKGAEGRGMGVKEK